MLRHSDILCFIVLDKEKQKKYLLIYIILLQKYYF
jgi:hypothetical protein